MKTIIATVISDRMEKTVTVEVKRQTAHPLYHKRVWSKMKYHVHDELGCRTGDRVKITETRPVSKTKRWRTVEIVSTKKKADSKGKIIQEKNKKGKEVKKTRSGSTKTARS